MNTSTDAAQLDGVTKIYRGRDGAGVTALDGLSLSIPTGRYLSVMGASGSGKSTLLHVLAGLTSIDQGRVTIAGEDISGWTDDQLTRFRRQRLGIIFQAYNLVPALAARDNVALPQLLDGRQKRQALERADHLLEQVGLADRRHHQPDALSGGEQQRVAIARALMNEPALLLADEPTGNLDSHATQAVGELFAQLHQDHGTTVVVITHEADVATYGEAVAVVADGRVRGQIEGAATADTRQLAEAYHALLATEGAA